MFSRIGQFGSNIANKFGSPTTVKKKPELSIMEDDEGNALALYPTYDLLTLRTRPLPDGVDHEIMEKHLSNQDFHATIGMSRKEWDKCPKWKKIKIKKEINLF